MERIDEYQHRVEGDTVPLMHLATTVTSSMLLFASKYVVIVHFMTRTNLPNVLQKFKRCRRSSHGMTMT
jgi:hypothetical protein